MAPLGALLSSLSGTPGFGKTLWLGTFYLSRGLVMSALHEAGKRLKVAGRLAHEQLQ